MAREIKKTNPNLIALIKNLRKQSYDEGVAIWKDVAIKLEKPCRNQAEVSLSHINKNTEEGEAVVIPGKVLSDGKLDHKVTVAALGFSKNAIAKLEKAGCEAVSIAELAESNPKGSNVKIML
ncbi:50S ribosomal protein L18e [uncultured Methanobrevibacter sp.]|uniref:50S ribosomal protein L18e n=1 Tax=uncultured Methanobrevibacter sp. TaxID=253161 RepID=UPI002616B1AC